jgi:hypothetical protein
MNTKQRMEWAIFLLLMQAWFFVLWTHGADWAWGVLGISGAVSLIGLIMLEEETIVSEPAVDPMHFEFDRPEPVHWNLPDLDAGRWLRKELERQGIEVKQDNDISYHSRILRDTMFICPENTTPHRHDGMGRHIS